MNIKVEARVVLCADKGKAIFPQYTGREFDVILPLGKEAVTRAQQLSAYFTALGDLLEYTDEDTLVPHLMALKGLEMDDAIGYIDRQLSTGGKTKKPKK